MGLSFSICSVECWLASSVMVSVPMRFSLALVPALFSKQQALLSQRGCFCLGQPITLFALYLATSLRYCPTKLPHEKVSRRATIEARERANSLQKWSVILSWPAAELRRAMGPSSRNSWFWPCARFPQGGSRCLMMPAPAVTAGTAKLDLHGDLHGAPASARVTAPGLGVIVGDPGSA